MNLQFSHESRRNTKCYGMRIGTLWVGISYDTIVAFRQGGVSARRENDWGPTTGRHLKDMGVYGWPEYGEVEFERLLDAAMLRAIRDELFERSDAVAKQLAGHLEVLEEAA